MQGNILFFLKFIHIYKNEQNRVTMKERMKEDVQQS